MVGLVSEVISGVAGPTLELARNSSFEVATIFFIAGLGSLFLICLLSLIEEMMSNNSLSKGDVFVSIFSVNMLMTDSVLNGLLELFLV